MGHLDQAGRTGTVRAQDHGQYVPALAAATLDRRDRHRAAARAAGLRGRVRADRRPAGAARGAGPAAAPAAGRGRAPLFRRSDRSADRGGDGLLGGRGQGTRVEGAGPAARNARAGRAHDRRCGVVNTEERQLAEMLHRVTPEPPRRVTVEDIAYRVASESRGPDRNRERAPRPRRGFSFSRRGWAPALAALSVVSIAGATVSIATVANSHHGNGPATDGTPTSSASVSSVPTSTSSTPDPNPTSAPLRIADGMWGATLINR